MYLLRDYVCVLLAEHHLWLMTGDHLRRHVDLILPFLLHLRRSVEATKSGLLMEAKIRILGGDAAGKAIAPVVRWLMQMLMLTVAHQRRYLAQEGWLLERRGAIRIA